jgi:hypothetical protein
LQNSWLEHKPSHSHPVSTGCVSFIKTVLTVSTVYFGCENKKPLKRLKNTGVNPVPPG